MEINEQVRKEPLRHQAKQGYAVKSLLSPQVEMECGGRKPVGGHFRTRQAGSWREPGRTWAAGPRLRALLTALRCFQILKILTGKIVVGHAVHNDFKALQYVHPKALTRDTSHIPPLNRKADCPENATMSLKHLTKKLLNRDIQVACPQMLPVEPCLLPLGAQSSFGRREIQAGCSYGSTLV